MISSDPSVRRIVNATSVRMLQAAVAEAAAAGTSLCVASLLAGNPTEEE